MINLVKLCIRNLKVKGAFFHHTTYPLLKTRLYKLLNTEVKYNEVEINDK